MSENKKEQLSSEDILGIEKQPEMSCPKINEAVKDVCRVIDSAKGAFRSIQYEDWDGVKSAVENIECDSSCLEDHFEYCRSQCELIRSWGQNWKDLAKRLIRAHEPELLESTEYVTGVNNEQSQTN